MNIPWTDRGAAAAATWLCLAIVCPVDDPGRGRSVDATKPVDFRMACGTGWLPRRSLAARDVASIGRRAERAARRAAPGARIVRVAPVVLDDKDRGSFPRLRPLPGFPEPARFPRETVAPASAPVRAVPAPIVIRPRIALAPASLDSFRPGVGLGAKDKRCPLLARNGFYY